MVARKRIVVCKVHCPVVRLTATGIGSGAQVPVLLAGVAEAPVKMQMFTLGPYPQRRGPVSCSTLLSRVDLTSGSGPWFLASGSVILTARRASLSVETTPLRFAAPPHRA